MGGHDVFVETDSRGNKRYVMRRYHHPHSRRERPCDDGGVHATGKRVEKLHGSEESLREDIRALARENKALKADLLAAEERYRSELRRLRAENTRSCDENDRLRDRIAALCRKLRSGAGRDAAAAAATAAADDDDGGHYHREHYRKVPMGASSLHRELDDWRRKYEDLCRRFRRQRDNLDYYITTTDNLTRENRATRRTIRHYETILERHELIRR